MQLTDNGELVFWKTCPLVPGVVIDGYIIDMDTCARELAQSLTPCHQDNVSEHVVPLSVIMGVPKSQTFVHVFTTRLPPGAVTEELVNAELLGALPFTLAEVVTDFIAEEAATKGSRVVCVAVRKPLLGAYTELCKRTNIVLSTVDLQIAALGRALLSHTSNAISIVVDMSARSTSLLLFRGTHLLQSTYIPIGGDMLIAAIKRVCPGMTEEELLTLKQHEGFMGTSPEVVGALSTVLAPVLHHLATVLQDTLALGLGTISDVYLTGESACTPGLAAFFERESGLITVIGNPFRHLTVLPIDTNIDASYATAIGLALRDAQGLENGFNLMRTYPVPSPSPAQSLWRVPFMLPTGTVQRRFFVAGWLCVLLLLLVLIKYVAHLL
jgi:Tfp pilus assembly PilM family ATPase